VPFSSLSDEPDIDDVNEFLQAERILQITDELSFVEAVSLGTPSSDNERVSKVRNAITEKRNILTRLWENIPQPVLPTPQPANQDSIQELIKKMNAGL